MAAGAVGVQVVRVDVEGDKANGREGRRENNGHVVSGTDADGGHISACTGAHVGDTILGKDLKNVGVKKRETRSSHTT